MFPAYGNPAVHERDQKKWALIRNVNQVLKATTLLSVRDMHTSSWVCISCLFISSNLYTARLSKDFRSGSQSDEIIANHRLRLKKSLKSQWAEIKTHASFLSTWLPRAKIILAGIEKCTFMAPINRQGVPRVCYPH